ncbi:hypothetical protein [Undibacter mobilis]|uniref:Uncharacterized protein n=1 Tax=Undibacter mobilis TaxID=2292256 RepID=A0A371BC41_9BRAD|nr:hypothetical protein [Undibacter mobilis]RDV05132.1 hypothetical protein DXH78_11495 [Undibacter mobilis]
MKNSQGLALRNEYTRLVGLFQGAWASLELTTDYAIGQFLNVTHEQCHLITAGMMFGRKSRLLADLIKRSDHPQKSKILEPFNKIRGMSKRDVFAHGYIRGDAESVTFLERAAGGEFKATEHTFTFMEFQIHVATIAKLATEFYEALGCTREQVSDFANAALSLNRKSKKSPETPKSRA